MPSHPPTDPDAYKALARCWAATVTVVTARRAPAEAGTGPSDPEPVDAASPELDGFTATAFLTVSISPPIVLVSVTNASSGLATLVGSGGFAVNLLSPGQAELANAFARPQAERVALWDRIAWTPDEAGAPLLGGTAGAFSARVREVVEAGDHTIVLGDVTAVHLHSGPESLLYHNRAYGRFQPEG